MHKLLIRSICLLLFFICGCDTDSKEKFIVQTEEFVTRTAKEAPDYTSVDWQNADEEFLDLKDNQYVIWEESMTPEEKQKVNALIGRYEGLRLKKDMHDVKDEVENFIQRVASAAEEVSNDSSIIN
jgi:hypothetical protein